MEARIHKASPTLFISGQVGCHSAKASIWVLDNYGIKYYSICHCLGKQSFRWYIQVSIFWTRMQLSISFLSDAILNIWKGVCFQEAHSFWVYWIYLCKGLFLKWAGPTKYLAVEDQIASDLNFHEGFRKTVVQIQCLTFIFGICINQEAWEINTLYYVLKRK